MKPRYFLFLILLSIGCKKEDAYPPLKTNSYKGIKADAGPDQTLLLPRNQVTLDASRSKDTSGKSLLYRWKAISNTENVSISEQTSKYSRADFYAAGSFLIQLEVYNDNGRALDTIEITVTEPAECRVTRSPASVNVKVVSAQVSEHPATQLLSGNGKLIIPDPYYQEGKSNRVQILDPVTANIITTEISEPRTEFAAIAASNKLFIAGGLKYNATWTSFKALATVDVFDLQTNTWSKYQLSEPRGFIKAVAINNKIFFAGGLLDNNNLSGRIDVFDLQTNAWTSTEMPFEPRAVGQMVAIGNEIYFIGGYRSYGDGNGFGDVLYNPTARIDIYDVSTGQWKVKQMNETRSEFGAIAVNNEVYLAGGYIPKLLMSTNTIEVLNSITGEQSRLCMSVKSNHYNTSAAAFGQSIIFFSKDNSKNQFDIYNAVSGSWSVASLPAGLGENNFYNAMAVVNSKIYMLLHDSVYEVTF